MSVTPRGMSVQEAYREYRDGNFRVNRRYQRKLVWRLEEKRKLVDSLLLGYPIPLFLFAVSSRPDGSRVYEIIDGMQRLNAIFGYIENMYCSEGKFFDVDQLSRAKQLADQGLFKPNTDPEQKLPPNQCADLLDYQLAITEFPGSNEEAVNEVFGRINSYGRHLSDQERRQAGVVTVFATTIRELAAQIRGDVSTDALDLANMPQISIDLGGDVQGYGILADDSFWCKQGVLRRNQLRESEDEQLLADLAISILKEEPFAFSGKNLDLIYTDKSQDSKEINDLLASYGTERIKNEIQGTISLIRETVEHVDPTPNALRRIVHPKGGANPIKTAFYSIFMAFFILCVRQRRTPQNPEAIMEALKECHSKLNISAGQIRVEPRQQNINITKGLIQDFFADVEPPAITHGSGAIIKLENAIRRSKIETASFECKQGLLGLDASRSRSSDLFDRIVQSICGIANIGPDSSGAIFIGVADSPKDKEKIEYIDSIRAKQIGSRFCVGVERELRYLRVDLEGYKRLIVSHISSSKLSQPLKTAVLGSIDCLNYKGLSVICIWVPSQENVSSVNDVVFVREGANTKRVDGLSHMQAVMALFRR